MAKYRTYTKEKWLYFAFSIVAYFLPFVIVTACLLPLIDTSGGFKMAMGLGIVLINAVPFLMGIFRSFFAHFPMLNMLAIIFLVLAAFFTLDIFQACVDKLLWIELAAGLGSAISCVLWAKHRKYSEYQKTMKATVKSGAFVVKEGTGD